VTLEIREMPDMTEDEVAVLVGLSQHVRAHLQVFQKPETTIFEAFESLAQIHSIVDTLPDTPRVNEAVERLLKVVLKYVSRFSE
jgi:hypothetical protein